MKITVNVVLLLLIPFLATSCTAHKTHYVKPDPHTNCPTEGQQCQTLAYYIENVDQYFTSNTTMIFLPGMHQLSNSALVIISDIENFAFVGSGEFDHTLEVWPGIPKPPAEIYCREEAACLFDNVSNLSIANITFSNCGATVHPTVKVALFLHRILNLHMEGVVVQNSSGYGILGTNVLGNVSIYKSTLILNGATGEYDGGNMRFQYILYSECGDDREFLSLTIHSSRFLLGHSHSDAAGLNLKFLESCYTAVVNISEVLFYGNRALAGTGGNMLMGIVNDVASNVEICICNSSFQYGEASNGAGLAFVVTNESSSIEMCSVPTKVSLLILNSSFLSNHAGDSGGGVWMSFLHKDSCYGVTAEISDITMDRNTAGGAGGGLAVEDYSDPLANISVTVSGSSVTRGSASYGGGIAYTSYHNPETNLKSSAEFAVSSLYTFRQFNITGLQFQDNTAYNGRGGHMYIQLESDSGDIQIYVYNNTFQYGEALMVGGGVAFATNSSLSDEMCLVPTTVSLLILNSSFLSNHAGGSGGGISMLFFHKDSCHEVTVDIRDVTMDRNTAGGNGGGLDLQDFSDSRARTSITVSGGSVTSGAAVHGGGMAYYSSYNSDTLRFSAENVFSLHTFRHLNITGLEFQNNSGGNMFIWLNVSHDYSPRDIQIHIYNSTFQSGVTDYGGGMVFAISQPLFSHLCLVPIKLHLLVQNSTFQSNIAWEDGGGLGMFFYSSPCHEVTADIKDVIMDRNTARRAGGGLAVEDLSDPVAKISVTVSGGSITRGSAAGGGGIAYLSYNNPETRSSAEFAASSWYTFRQFNITGLQLHNNTAYNGSGGNMHMQFELGNDSPTDIQIYIYNSTYQYGEAQGFGGGMCIKINNDNESCSTTDRTLLLHIENNYFLANHASGRGGGLCLQFNHSCYHSKAVVTNNTFKNNIASLEGGAIFAVADFSHSSSVNVSVNHCSVSGGSALSGGGIYMIYRIPTTQTSFWGIISDSEIMNNSATLDGGGVAIIIVSYNYYLASAISDEFARACTSYASTGNITLYVLDTVIANNAVKQYYGGGMYIEVHNPTCISTSIHIADSIFSSNQAVYRGGNIAIIENILALASVITLQNCIVNGGEAPDSGGMRIDYISAFQLPRQCNCTSSDESQRVIYINNTHFIGNVAHNAFGSTHITFAIDTQDVDKDTLSQFPVKVIELENCVFSGNCNREDCIAVSTLRSSALYPEVGCIYELRIQTSTFKNGYGSLLFSSTCKVVISDSQFIGNEYTALQAVSSNIFFEGNTLFERNSGFNGGALSLLGGSTMFLENNTNIMFRGNYAQHAGGAIYVNDFKSFKSTQSQCFFQPHLSRFDYVHGNPNINIYMEDNTARMAGSSLYGGYVDSCLTYWPYANVISNITLNINSSQVFDSIFHLSPNESDFSPIASDPIGVCICEDDKLQCEERTFNSSGFPGALLVIPAVAVGERSGVVRDGVIVAVQLGKARADDKQETVCTDKTLIRSTLCQDVQFRLHSPNGTVNVTLMPGNQEGTVIFADTYLSLLVDILPCPLGFQLQQTQQEQYACTCDFILQRHRINCSIDSQTIQRPPESWIGINCTDLTDFCGVIIHDHCPFHYCRNEELNLHLNDSDSQCNLNHSGILCGGCRPGYSLVLGTSRCLQCSNKFLSLFLVFLIAGLALVFLLMLCNMTVSDGTINGLIFYANIVGINSATFFPTGQGNLFTSFLSVFIAWINLDLGIETCFYDRMDMYQKTWLQFVFPLYIWAIVLFLITATHYSTLASKVLVRRNAVKVLSTLILLSFAKLLRTTVATFSFVILEYPDGNNKAVWLYDGNIDYLTEKHIPLFVAALLVFVLLMLPYTVVLTFSQCIQRKSNHQLLSWYTKLRLQPLFDAYAGPYKDRYRFWSGLLVIVRIVLFLVFAVNALGNPNVNLLAITIVTTLLFGGTVGLSVYKKWPLTVLESLLLINLCLLSASTHFVRSSGGSQAAVTGTLVGLVFASFIGTLSYRAYQELKKTKLGVWVRNTCMQISHIPAGWWRHVRVDQQSQQDEPGQPVPRRAPVQHWEIALGDPVSGEATLIPISSGTHPQSTQSQSPRDTNALARAREYSAEMYRHRYCPPESPIPSLSPSHHNVTSDPLQPGAAHLDTDPAPTDPLSSDSTTSGHTGTDSHSNTTHYRAQVLAFIGSTSDDNPEYENYNELEIIQHHSGEDNLHPSQANTTDYTEEAPSYSSSSDYRNQIFEILAFDSGSHDCTQFEPENSNPVQAIHHDEDGDSDTPVDEHQRLLKN